MQKAIALRTPAAVLYILINVYSFLYIMIFQIESGDSQSCTGISGYRIQQCQAAGSCGKYKHEPGPGGDGDAESCKRAV